MPIAFDAAIDGGNNGGTSSSHSFSHTCTGSDRFLFVATMGGLSGDGDLITGATYDSVAMTLVTKRAPPNGGCRWSYLFALAAPASGANSVVVSASGTVYILPGASSYTGVHQSGQPEASGSEDDLRTAMSVNVTTLTDLAWGILFGGSYNADSPSAGANTVERAQDGAFGVWGLFDPNAAWTPVGSKTLNASYPAGADTANLIIAAFAPIGVSGVGTFLPPRIDAKRIRGRRPDSRKRRAA